MPQGLQVFNAAGTLVFDTGDTLGGQLVDVITETTSAATYSYASFAGYSVDLHWASGYSQNAPTVSYALGYPQVTLNAYADATRAATFFVLVI